MTRPRIEPFAPVAVMGDKNAGNTEDATVPKIANAEYNEWLDKAKLSKSRKFKCHLITDEELKSLMVADSVLGIIFTLMGIFVAFWLGIITQGGIPENVTTGRISLYACMAVVGLSLIAIRLVFDWRKTILSNLGEAEE